MADARAAARARRPIHGSTPAVSTFKPFTVWISNNFSAYSKHDIKLQQTLEAATAAACGGTLPGRLGLNP